MLWNQIRSWLRNPLSYLSMLIEPFVMWRTWSKIKRKHGEKKMKTILFVRHPHTDEEIDKVYRGDHAEITDLGWEQAKLVADRIAEMSSITHIVTSTLPRSRQLAELIATEVAQVTFSLPIYITSDLFVEVKKPSELVDVRRGDPEAVHIGKRIRTLFDFEYRHSDEENRWRLELRLWKAVWFLAELDAECVVVVTHGKFLRALWHFLYKGGRFKRFYQEADRVLKHDHTALTILELEPSFRKGTVQWNLKSWNDVSHRELLISSRLKSELLARP